MKILIVDDEKIIRHGMVNGIPWDKIGVDVVLEAHDGAAALAVFEQEHPDILLTDIRMPVMDGIALAAEVRRRSADVQIIYLTGHQDIAYIKAAFQNGAVDYILKPVELDELVRVLEKAVRLCSESAGLRMLRLHTEQKLLQSQPFFIRQLLANLVEGRYQDAGVMEEKLRFWNIQLDIGGTYMVLIAALREYSGLPTQDREIIAFGVENILQEIMESCAQGYAFHLRDENKFVCIKPHNLDDRGELELLIGQIRTTISRFLPEGASIAVGAPVDGLFNLHESFQYAVLLLIRRFYEGGNGVYYYDRDTFDETGCLPIDKERLDNLSKQLRAKAEDQNEQSLGGLVGIDQHALFQSKEHLRAKFLFIASYLLGSLSGDEISKQSIDLFTHCAEELYLCDSIETVQSAMVKLLSGLRQAMSQRAQDPNARIVEEIKSVLSECLAENITISDLSKRVFLTPQYLCAVFKQQARMTINEYLTAERVKQAKKLLATGKYKLYEIAPAVGYKDVKYFSKVFKRLAGVTPSEYAGEALG